MLRSKAMVPMFRLPFVCCLLCLDFGHNGCVIMTILLLINELAFLC